MKKAEILVGVVFSVLALCLIGCSEKSNDELIVGKWKRTTETFQYYGSIYQSDNYGNTNSVGHARGMGVAKITFNKNKSGLMVHNYFGSSGELKTDSVFFTYNINGDSLYITGRINLDCQEETFLYKLDELTRKKMVVSRTGCPMHGYYPREHDYWADYSYILERR